ncbi:MAG TPA: Tat pathway signal sequence domain protein [Caulobacterales bacterium]|nr:Tat pathway signal sequence domain protein [Caulobacterales bacterium]
MKLLYAAALALGALSLGACAHGNGRTVELPGGGPTHDEAQANDRPNFFERMTGRDNRQNVGPCPLMGVLYDASRVVEFAAPDQERYANINFTGEMEGVHGLCRYIESDPITMSISIDMSFGRGPAATSEHKVYRYWVAVARRDRAPIEKQYFDVDIAFRPGQSVVNHTEEINHIVIPRAQADTSGENFEVLVGFDLSPQQLAFNRAGKRFRIDAGTNANASSN